MPIKAIQKWIQRPFHLGNGYDVTKPHRTLYLRSYLFISQLLPNQSH